MKLYNYWKNNLKDNALTKVVVEKITLAKGDITKDVLFNGYAGDMPTTMADADIISIHKFNDIYYIDVVLEKKGGQEDGQRKQS